MISTGSRRFVPALALLAFVLTAAVGPVANAAQPAEADTTVVRGLSDPLGRQVEKVEGRDRIDQILQESPFALIRRGTGSVSDLYVDGFKRGDVTLTVDGERFMTACPNRMDTRVGQVDLMDVETVSLSREGAGLQAGLGGQIDFHRRRPGQDRIVSGRLGGMLDSEEGFEGSLSWEQNRIRAGLRARVYSPYVDADDGTFVDRYGYSDEYDTEIYEVRAHAAHDQGDVYAAYETSTDVLFPYLLMDERENDHYQLSGSWGAHRLYFNRTEHLMDNALRTSYAMTDMVTDATNTQFGATGRFYDLTIRNWDADNRITPVAMPAMEKNNHMLPDVWRVGATLRHALGEENDPWLVARAGLVHTSIGDDSVLDLYRALEPDAEDSRWSVPVGVTLSRHYGSGAGDLVGASLEASTAAPGIEQMYIATDKPGTKPDWIGNPELKDPARVTGRLAWRQSAVRCEVFATRVWEYSYLVKRAGEGAMIQTYDGVDAVLAGASARARWMWFEGGVQWNWGEKLDGNQPLAEIQPVTVLLTAESPRFHDLRGRVEYRHAAGQGRIDPTLDEEATGAWNRVDLSLDWKHARGTLALEVVNLTNVLYSQHLSYLRSPFASGRRIDEPGRSFRLMAGFDL